MRDVANAKSRFILYDISAFVNMVWIYFKRQSPVRSIEEPSGASRYGDLTYHKSILT
jgi:hypothetical protein